MDKKEKVKRGLFAHSVGCGKRSSFCDGYGCPYIIDDESCDIEQLRKDALTVLTSQGIEIKRTNSEKERIIKKLESMIEERAKSLENNETRDDMIRGRGQDYVTRKDAKTVGMMIALDVVKEIFKEFRPLMLGDALDAFNCCVSTPPDCAHCPLLDKEKYSKDKYYLKVECKKQVIDSVRYWRAEKTVIVNE